MLLAFCHRRANVDTKIGSIVAPALFRMGAARVFRCKHSRSSRLGRPPRHHPHHEQSLGSAEQYAQLSLPHSLPNAVQSVPLPPSPATSLRLSQTPCHGRRTLPPPRVPVGRGLDKHQGWRRSFGRRACRGGLGLRSRRCETALML